MRTQTPITLDGMRTQVWNGTPIEYHELELPKAYGGTVFALCADYKRAGDNFPRYVAIRDSAVVAVEIDEGFCNMIVDPLFEGGSMLFPPDYERRDSGLVYRVPVVRLASLEAVSA